MNVVVERPVGYQLLIKPIVEEEYALPSGVIVSNVNKADLAVGKIVEVPDQLKDVYMFGEKVLYHEKRGIGILHNGEPHFFINGGGGVIEPDVLAVIK
jgi:co-chaperonin GroES (HSP10)